MSGRAIVIPALNEVDSIDAVVRAAIEIVDTVIVVDDGSTDGTAAAARRAGAEVISHARNLGVGAAVATGLASARDRGCDQVVQLDGDGQHDPCHVRDLFSCLDEGADLALGTRFELGFQMGWVRRVMTRLFAWIISRRIGEPVSDPTSGFRAFDQRAMAALIPIFPTHYLSDTVELLLLAAERGLVIRTVPVRMRPRRTGRPSSGPLRSVGYAMRMLWIIAKHSVPGVR
jgi:glycosyltransferase involved in cell wall biosynthesis